MPFDLNLPAVSPGDEVPEGMTLGSQVPSTSLQAPKGMTLGSRVSTAPGEGAPAGMTLGSRVDSSVSADPVMSAKSFEDLVKNRDFSPIQYWGANPKTRNIPGMEDLLTKVWTAKEAAPMDLSLSGALDFAKKAGSAAWGVGKQALSAAAATNKARLGVMTPQEASNFALENAAGVETGVLTFADFAEKLYHGLAAAPVWLARKISSAVGKETPSGKQTESDKAAFVKTAVWAEQMAKVAKGEGEFAKSNLGKVAGTVIEATVNPALPTRESLAATPEANPEVVGGLSLVENPMTVLPVAAASGALGKTVTTLAKASGITNTAIGGWAADLVSGAAKISGRMADAVSPSNVIARTAQAAGGTLRGAGKVLSGGPAGTVPAGTVLGGAEVVAGALTGHFLAGGVAGVATAAGAKVIGEAAVWSGQKILDIGTRIQQRSGLLFQVLDATFNAPVGGAARAAATTLPLAALMPKEDRPGFIGSMAAIGAMTGAAVGAARGAGIAATATGQHAALKTFAESFRGPEIKSPGYGDTALDSAHLNSMAKTDLLSKSIISHVREFMRNLPTGEGKPSRTEMYLLEDKPFQDITGEDGSGWIAHEVIAPDGTRVHRIFINRTGSKYSPYHEAAHALEAYMDQFHPDRAAEVHASIDALPPESLQMFDDLYTSARIRDNPGQKIDPLTPKQLHSEIFAEMVGAFLKGSDLQGIPRMVHTSIWGALGIALEDLGLYVPGVVGAGATPVAPAAKTPLGMTPSFKVASEASQALHGAGVGPQNRGPLASPQVFPEGPLAGGKPPKFTNVTPKGIPAAPGPAPGPRGPRVGPIAPVASDDASWRQVLDNAEQMGLTPEQTAAVQRLYDHRQAAGSAAEVGPVELNYESVESGTPGQPPTRTPVRTAQEQAYIEEALTGLPSQLRETIAKLFVPGRLVVRPSKLTGKKNVNVLGFSPEKPLANAINAARAAVAKEGVGTDLVPYTTDVNGLTGDAAAEYVADLGKWSQNVSHGRLGTGEEMVVPETYQGQLPEVDPNYVPQPLSRERADFVNLTMGIEPPRTARVSASRRNPDTGKLITRPGNVEAADLAAANKRALTGATFSKGEFKSPTGDQPIQEPNQLRARYAADSPGRSGSGIQLDKLLHEVTEEINVENIVAPIVPVESAFRGNKLTGPATAGFMPKIGEEVSIPGPDGKPVKFRYDGLVNYEPFVPGNHSQLTALENGPGDVVRGSTYSFGEKTLGDLGYKVPNLQIPEGQAMPKGAAGPQQPKVDGNAIRKSETLKVDLEAMKAGTSFGTTINLDGTPWNPPAGSKLDIVSVGSFNFPRENLSNEVVAKLVHKNSEFFLAVSDSRPGLFNLDKVKGPNGEAMSSIDLNVAVDQSHRANTIAFAKASGQEAIWDAAAGEVVDTGGNGIPKITSTKEMIDAANAIVEGRPHSFTASKSPSGAAITRRPGQSMPRGELPPRKTPPGVELSEDRPIPVGRKGYTAQEIWVGQEGVFESRGGHLGWLMKNGFGGDYEAAESVGFLRVVIPSGGNIINVTPSSKYPTWESVPKGVKKQLTNLSLDRNEGVSYGSKSVMERPEHSKEPAFWPYKDIFDSKDGEGYVDGKGRPVIEDEAGNYRDYRNQIIKPDYTTVDDAILALQKSQGQSMPRVNPEALDRAAETSDAAYKARDEWVAAKENFRTAQNDLVKAKSSGDPETIYRAKAEVTARQEDLDHFRDAAARFTPGQAMPRSNAYGELDTPDRIASSGPRSIRNLRRPGSEVSDIIPFSTVGKKLADEGYTFTKTLDASRSVLELIAFDKTGDRVGDIELTKYPGELGWTTALIDVATAHRRKGLGEALTREAANVIQDMTGATRLYGNIVSPKAFALREKVFGLSDTPASVLAKGRKSLADYMEATREGVPDTATDTGYFDIGTVASRIRPASEGRYMPADSAGIADPKETRAAKKAWAEQGTDSPFFKRWSGGAPVLEEGYVSNSPGFPEKIVSGEPVVIRAFHGTTHKFDQFKTKRSNPENSFGIGHYFTTDFTDAGRNYKGEGPDLTSRIERRVHELMDDAIIDRKAAEAQARKELSGKSPRVIDAYVKMENPLVLEPNGGTRFTLSIDEVTNAESGSGIDLYNSILRVAKRKGVDGQKLWELVLDDVINESPAYDIFDLLRTDEIFSDEVNGGDFVSEVARDMGFDGIVDGGASARWPSMRILRDAKHIVVWDPAQIKGAVDNRGTFSATDPRYQFMPKLEDAVGDPLDVVHYSSKAGLTKTSPEFFGAGKATPVDRRGGDKTYFFVRGSKLGQDREFAAAGLNRYEATLDGKKIYDATGADPLNWLGEINREVADDNVVAAGYTGIYTETRDGRKVVAMFKPVKIEATGQTKAQGKNAGAFMAKLPDYSGEFDLGQDVVRESLLARARRTIRQSRAKFDEAIPMKPMTDSAGNVRMGKDGTPMFQRRAYNFEDSPMWRRLAKESSDGDPVPALVEQMLPEFREAMKDPKSREGVTWYRDAQRMIEEKLGVGTEDANLFSQLLAATSAQTEPVQNFKYAFDLFNQVKSGEFEPKLKRYAELLGEWEGYAPQQWREMTSVFFRDNPEAKLARIRDLQEWILDKEGILPRSTTSGKKIGINSRAALDVLANRWLEVNSGDKTRRYFQNLTGDRVEATVDRWAARWLHRQLNEGERKQWRILPQAEAAVQPKDYAAANSVLQALAERTGLDTPEVQAVLWFWEKQLWAENDWTKGAGREMGSYIPQLKRIERLPGGTLRLKPEDLKPTAPKMKTLDLFGKK